MLRLHCKHHKIFVKKNLTSSLQMILNYLVLESLRLLLKGITVQM